MKINAIVAANIFSDLTGGDVSAELLLTIKPTESQLVTIRDEMHLLVDLCDKVLREHHGLPPTNGDVNQGLTITWNAYVQRLTVIGVVGEKDANVRISGKEISVLLEESKLGPGNVAAEDLPAALRIIADLVKRKEE